MTTGFEVGFIFLLLLLNGLFAMAEMAVVTARKTRLKQMADEGHGSAKIALHLKESQGRFLSTVQVGITLFGVLSGVIGGATLASKVAAPFRDIAWMTEWVDYAAFVLMSLVITYFSVIIGELVPKRLALSNPERIALLIARPMTAISYFFSPIVTVLNASSSFLLMIFGIKKHPDSAITEEEVHVLIDEGLDSGVFNPAEKEMVEGVFELDEQTAGDLMTPRIRMIMLCAEDTAEENWRKIANSGHSHFPVYEDQPENILGMVAVKSLWANISLVGEVSLRSVITEPLFVPTSMPSRKLVEEFRRVGRHNALVVDEFGGLEGIVTLNDVMEAVFGDVTERDERRNEPKALKREDGSWLMDALLEIDNLKEILGIEEDLPGEEENEFTTLGGFLLSRFEHIPHEGEKISCAGHSFEILDLDRQRIDKVLVKIATAVQP